MTHNDDLLNFDPAYAAHLLNDLLESGTLLASPLDRLATFNACDSCGAAPTSHNPTTIYAGYGADLENGPSIFDLPYTVCDSCD